MRFLLVISLLIKVSLASERPNVLLIMADDFNHWLPAIGYYKGAKTPNLDRLAQKGVLFQRAYNSSPVCNPSRNALWSGYYPATTGIMSNQGGYIRSTPGFEETVTMNQFFTEEGWLTLGGGKLYHPGKMGGPETDPEHWSRLYLGDTGSPGGQAFSYRDEVDKSFNWGGGDFEIEQAGDTQLALHMADFVNKYSDEKPFFVACGLFRPHLPWRCHQRFFDLYPLAEIQIPPGYLENDLNDVAKPGNRRDLHERILKENKWKEAIRAYLANLSYADYNVGLILDALEKSPARDNTLILFMGDHGWHLGEKDRWSKHAVFDQANRTTLIVYDPRAKGNGRICPHPVSLQDIYPTLVSLCGLKAPPHLQGNDLSPLLQEPTRGDWKEPVFISYQGTHSIRTSDWTFIDQGQASQLYHVANDPHEWQNLYQSPEQQSRVKELQKALARFLTNCRK